LKSDSADVANSADTTERRVLYFEPRDYGPAALFRRSKNEESCSVLSGESGESAESLFKPWT